ncbi:meiotic expression up-regulated 26, partial [Fusarium beomiforme]
MESLGFVVDEKGIRPSQQRREARAIEETLPGEPNPHLDRRTADPIQRIKEVFFESHNEDKVLETISPEAGNKTRHTSAESNTAAALERICDSTQDNVTSGADSTKQFHLATDAPENGTRGVLHCGASCLIDTDIVLNVQETIPGVFDQSDMWKNMNSNDFTENEFVLGSGEIRSTPTTQCKLWAMHNCDAQSYSTVSYWDPSSVSFQKIPSEAISRPGSMDQDLYPPTTTIDSSWMENPVEVQFNLQGEGFNMATNEAIPMLDLKQGTLIYEDQMAIDDGSKLYCTPGSSFFTPTSSPYYDGSSPAVSGACSFSPSYSPLDNRTAMMISAESSSVASGPMTLLPRTDISINQSRNSCASPSSRNHNHRYAPYRLEGSSLEQCSQVTANTSPSRKPVQHGHQARRDDNNSRQNFNSDHSFPANGATPLSSNYLNLQAMQEAPLILSSIPVYQRDNMLLPTQLSSQTAQQHPWQTDVKFAPPQPLLSHGLSRMLQSNGDAACLNGHYTDLSDPPELYAALREEQIPPPSEDMNPEDPEMIPCEQELRFEGDLYTPRWVRGRGNKREGWCGICKPGRWLGLKSSAFWYDKLFSHGISAATGSSFQEPQQKRRMDGKPDVWEGLCGSCEQWIALVSSKEKRTTWFRHAYKCHTHLK